MKRTIFLLLFAIMVILVSCSKDDDDLEGGNDDDPIDTTYFEESFDKMVWGGDYIADQPGLRAIYARDEDDMAYVDETEEPEECTPGRDGSGDFYYHMADSYLIDRRMIDWDGSKVYERPGYIKVGTGSSRDAYLVTPPLEKISEENVDVDVTFNIARWEGASTQVFIEIVGGGTASVEFVEVPEAASWEAVTFSINGATSETKIRFVCDPRDDGRFFLDDLVISKTE